MSYHGPEYPVQLGVEVARWRARARVEKLTREQIRAYGEAVGKAIRKQQRIEILGRNRSVSLKVPPIKRSHSPLAVRYSKPNPFRMVGDPAVRTEETLYNALVRA